MVPLVESTILEDSDLDDLLEGSWRRLSSTLCLVQPWEEPAEPATREMVGSFPACSLRKDGRFTGLGTESFNDEEEDEEGGRGSGEGADEEDEDGEGEEILVDCRERETTPPWLMLLPPP
jgi:hypothetical protein